MNRSFGTGLAILLLGTLLLSPLGSQPQQPRKRLLVWADTRVYAIFRYDAPDQGGTILGDWAMPVWCRVKLKADGC